MSWRNGTRSCARLLAASGLLGLLALASGCALYLDPGPNPARLVVNAQASVTTAMVEGALERKAHLHYKPLGGGEDVSEPLWDLRAFVTRADGSLTPLRPVKPVENVEGYDFAGAAEFLAPTGVYPVLFLLECSVRHVSLAGPTVMVEYIYMITWRQEQTLEFCPGCRLELSPFAGRTSQP